MPYRPQPCSGSGQVPSHTYTRQVRGSGGVVRHVQTANCPVNHAHYDLPIINGKVGDHAQ